jgi:hypothetical protein
VEIERDVTFCLETGSPEAARRLLARPDEALRRIPVFRNLRLEGDELQGQLTAAFALLGEVHFPFRSRFTLAGAEAGLEDLDPGPHELRARLNGRARLEAHRVCYRARVHLEVRLPEGEKWGGRVFKKMAEAAFERTLERTLAGLIHTENAGLLD